MDYQEIIAGTVGKENTYGTCCGRIKTGPFTFLRVSTDDLNGRMRAYLGEGEFEDDPVTTFGGYGVARIPQLQDLLAHICAFGFEHHVAITMDEVGMGVFDALANYLDWDIYHHG
jgi:L-fucose isomerase-like protein